MDWGQPWVEPHAARQAMVNSDEFAWRLFVAISWPADVKARAPAPSALLGADGPVVWETWQNSADVYRENGSDPGPWTTGESAPAVARESRFETLSLKDLKTTRHIVDGVMVPLVDNLAQAPRLVEVRMNRASFDYIRSRQLYNIEGQLQAVAAGRSVKFPPGALQVKASWRPIDVGQKPRYHTITVQFENGTSRLYGLTALNIAAKESPNWFWASFEHVDNETRANTEGWQLPSRDSFACGGAFADCNRAPRGAGVIGTVWENYRLRGTLTSFVDVEGRARLLANSELEAGLQRSASCITCHSRASIGQVDGQAVRLPIFDTSETTTAASGRRGYVGLPQARWFERCAGGRGTAFQPLDFVWSLSQAKPRAADSINIGDSP